MKAIVLCLDKSLKGFDSEHGLSILLEIGDEYYLFDTGSTDVAIKNAKKLNIDLSKLTAIIISHGHYDHIGGLESFLKLLKDKVKVYVGPGIFLPKFSDERYIGTPVSKGEYEKLGAEFHEVSEITQLSKNVYILPRAPLVTWEEPPDKFNILTDGERKRDLFNEELTILITNNNSATVVTGCSHRGIGNIVLDISENWKIENLIGGLHLLDKERAEIEKIVDIFENLKIKRLYVGHCTGDNAIDIFKEYMGTEVNEIMAGQIFSF